MNELQIGKFYIDDRAQHIHIIEMNHIVRTIIFGAPIGITFVDNIGYIARVDGEAI